MKVIRGHQWISSNEIPKSVVVIGNFDGVHLGHQELLKVAHAASLSHPGSGVWIYTFRPHPTHELRPENPSRLLMTYDEKIRILAELKVEGVVEEPFDFSFSKTEANSFFQILKDRMNSKAIVVGSDFAFGKNRSGNVETLKLFCQETGIQLHVVGPVTFEGQVVSSSRIRSALEQGDLVSANRLLGRPFFYRGEIVHGDKRGRTLGFPTANMNTEEKFPLPKGVYASTVYWRNAVFPAVTNIGQRPTFQSDPSKMHLIPVRIETHLLGQNFDLYGEILEVRFKKKLRDEMKFSSVDALKSQIESDIQLAHQFLSERQS